jgi:hypothetical protein
MSSILLQSNTEKGFTTMCGGLHIIKMTFLNKLAY